MAQSATTVTPENPTPPTNLSSVGIYPPMDPAQVVVDDGIAATVPNPGNLGAANGNTLNEPSGSRIVFAAKTAGAGTSGYTSVDAEGKGTETSVTQTYNPVVYNPAGALVMVGTTANYTTAPNRDHASTLSPATNPTLTSLSATSTASGSGTVSQTCTGTGFTKQSIVYVNGVAQATTFTSSTSLTAPTVTKKATAGTWPVTVVTGGVVTTAAQTWTFT